jgi:hypothetical protein
MLRETPKKTFLEKLRETSSLFITLFLVVALPVTVFLVLRPQDIRQRAAANKTATISIIPSSGTYAPGQDFTLSLVIDGGGQTFNAAQATVSVSSNLSIQSLTITPQGSGGCNFTFVKTNKTPSASNPSFAGGILQGFSNLCTLYTMVVRGTSNGPASVTIGQSSVKGYDSHGEILQTTLSGIYTIGNVPTPTPSPTVFLTPTPTPAQPTPSPTVFLTPTPTPAQPTPTIINVPPPTIDNIPSDTYQEAILLQGTKDPTVTQIWVGNSAGGTMTNFGVIYPTSTTWQVTKSLATGPNTFTIFGKNSAGLASSNVTATINLHSIGDINGDNTVDLTDLSIFGVDWENTGALNNPLSDMNGDGIVDLADFSIIAKTYGFVNIISF